MRRLILGLAAVAATAVAAPSFAQGWGGYGDYWRGQYGFQDYPEFRGEIAHIRGEIRQGINEGWLQGDQARQLGWRLRQVQYREAREFRYHGWDLPADDRAQIRSDLNQLDHWVDQVRDDGGDREWGDRSD
jgi:hypothetical protein